MLVDLSINFELLIYNCLYCHHCFADYLEIKISLIFCTEIPEILIN